MVIDKLQLWNFRCFRELEIEFGRRATILFGKNGSGKTTIINAIHKAFSFIMFSERIYEKKERGKKRKLLEVKSISKSNPYLKVEGFSKLGDYNDSSEDLIEIKARGELASGQGIEWSMSAYSDNGRLRTSEFKEAFREFYKWHLDSDTLPLLAYYSDCFPHKEDQKKATIKVKVAKLRNFGYFDWNEVEGCTKEWLSRLAKDLLNISQGMELINRLTASENAREDGNEEAIASKRAEIDGWRREVEAIERVLIDFSQGLLLGNNSSIEIVGISIHPDLRLLSVVTASGQEIPFIHLPAGYKRIFSMVLDIAFRAYILSKGTSVDIPGIVVIDEVDLHLHPELESVVLPKLMRMFPNVQFIVSTHSYGVLTSVPPSEDVKIIHLDSPGIEPSYFSDIYGLDPNTTLQEVMGVRLNGEELERLIARCAYMQSIGLKEQSENLKGYIAEKNLISGDELARRINLHLERLR